MFQSAKFIGELWYLWVLTDVNAGQSAEVTYLPWQLAQLVLAQVEAFNHWPVHVTVSEVNLSERGGGEQRRGEGRRGERGGEERGGEGRRGEGRGGESKV